MDSRSVTSQRPPQHSTRTNNRGKSHVTLQPRSRAWRYTNLTSAVTSSLPVPPCHGCRRTSSQRHEAEFHWDLQCATLPSRSWENQVHNGLRTPKGVLTDAVKSTVDFSNFASRNCLAILAARVLTRVELLRPLGLLLLRWVEGTTAYRSSGRYLGLFPESRYEDSMLLWNRPIPAKPRTRNPELWWATSSGPYGLALVCLCCADELMSIADKPSWDAALGADTSLNILVLVLPSSQHTFQGNFVQAGYHYGTLYTIVLVLFFYAIRRPGPLFSLSGLLLYVWPYESL